MDHLDQLIEQHHVLKHPFYRAWSEGTLPKESLQLYASQYYQHVLAFPENLRQLAGRTGGHLGSLIQENLDEELDPLAPHPVLWRQFAEAVGVDQASLNEAHPLPGVAVLLDAYDEIASQGTVAQAVAAFYVYEAQVPETAVQKKSGLKKFYDVNDPRALAYFEVHEEADVRHRAAWRSWLAEQNDEDLFGVLCAAERSLKALWGALDAIYPQACASSAN
ncbi:MAG TPA: iron-containing redox enzyme family protein [Candidatus Aquilonibacter sp.]|nr:iron-containing redox enzyme family protein [Candidatus Aquilonibacter sp.]